MIIPRLNRCRAVVTGLALSLCLSLGLAHAHHSYVSKYNPKKQVTIAGTISSVSYTNPHVFFSVQTSGGSWRVETESIPKLRAKGLTKARLKAGRKVRVTGWRARSGGGAIGMRSISFIGGKSFTIRSSPR